MCWLAIWTISLWIDRVSQVGVITVVTSIFWEIINNISEMVHSGWHSHDVRLIGNHHIWPIEWYDCQRTWVMLKRSLSVSNHCSTHNSGNIVYLNYSVFTQKLESTRGLWFKHYCQRWRTSQGHRQLHTLNIPLLQAFSCVIFCICGTLHGLSASTEFFVCYVYN